MCFFFFRPETQRNFVRTENTVYCCVRCDRMRFLSLAAHNEKYRRIPVTTTTVDFSKERAFYTRSLNMVRFRILFNPSPTYLNNLPLGARCPPPISANRPRTNQLAHATEHTHTRTQIPRPMCSRVLGPVFIWCVVPIYVYTIVRAVCYLPVGIVGSW